MGWKEFTSQPSDMQILVNKMRCVNLLSKLKKIDSGNDEINLRIQILAGSLKERVNKENIGFNQLREIIFKEIENKPEKNLIIPILLNKKEDKPNKKWFGFLKRKDKDKKTKPTKKTNTIKSFFSKRKIFKPKRK